VPAIRLTGGAVEFELACLLKEFDRWQVEFWLCLLLTFLAYLPGIIYAIYAITKD
jgi:uncharacterized membrane protein YqaE (UPF0057 family)